MNIAVIALGKIGLPLAVQFASKGNRVLGCDIDKTTVKLVNEGIEPFSGEAFLAEKLRQVVKNGTLTATMNTVEAVTNSEFVVVVVPLVVNPDGIPNFEGIDSATHEIAKGLKPGALISFETTLPVGTTRNRFAKILENVSGLRAGSDFSLVFSPERVFTGRVFSDLQRYPKLIGGFTKSCAARGTEFYTSVLDFDERPELSKPNGVWNLGLCEAAEFAKLAETTYRDVNIGLANQFAKFADKNELDVFKIIEACNSQPYSHIHQPGIAVGGHCIPIYSQFYLWNDPEAQIVRAAREVNQGMPNYGVELLEKKHGLLSGQRVAVLGATYRGGVKDTSFSGVFAIVAALQEKNATVFVHDPMFSADELESLGFNPYTLGQSLDAAIIQADHKEYESLNRELIGNARTVLDGRNLAFTKLKVEVEVEVVSIGNITRIHDSIEFTDQ
jgi:nucleotide sugar dehydrogenase